MFNQTEYNYNNMFKVNGTRVKNTGIENIVPLMNYISTDHDTFLCFDLQPSTLSLHESLFDLSKVSMNGEEYIVVHHQHFYNNLSSLPQILTNIA